MITDRAIRPNWHRRKNVYERKEILMMLRETSTKTEDAQEFVNKIIFACLVFA
jgi:hypothetical protein